MRMSQLKDIKVINIETNTEEDTIIFFPNPVNTIIYCHEVETNISGKEGESIHIEGKSSSKVVWRRTH